ncbi:plasmid pRiA4b ORF-3 family protein [Pseudovibrio sp. Tun.PSC04-5.I4]|uniref:plasmid pRiA4b ORF-3 family protein n=1 Tax=Pseudovibrio sp. Tun.PSC04-5.I4 TaxID=1798213 RepID=UPI000884D67D|nr:plasmid pRiA4b ORF-3 family protein [Pseudovibrio sp. Tun.PSC04-5.I4]SDR45767.1 pRiA4b ORF-3-like protein [Pseudovibrio sp. Tun.PSC04-5.I4]
MASLGEIIQLKIRLLGISPMIWRRILVLSSTTLHELHGILQVVMGWDGIHLFQFDIRAVDYGSWELHMARPDNSLCDFGFRRYDRFFYIYDMGSYWRHEVRVESLLDTDPKKFYPICTGGTGACPPEDCGGASGFLVRRDEANGYDAWRDLDLLSGFAKDLLDCRDTERSLSDLDLEELQFAVDRVNGREPFTSWRFSRKQLNAYFREGRHRELMHQQLI